MDDRASLKRPGLFEFTVSALCYSIGAEQAAAGDEETAPYNDVANFVLEQWQRMPRFLAWPLRAATILFAVSAMRRGALFHRLEPARRAALVSAWSTSRVGPCRDLMRFYRSLALLALYSRAASKSECLKTFSARM